MAEIIKHHIYRIYRDGRYLGILKNVTSDFGYTQNLGTAFASMQITVQQNPVNASEAVVPITTEDGLALTTELGETITTEGAEDVLGISNENALIRNNNSVLVYEVSNRYPEGTKVFSGRIVEWHARIGTSDDISIEVLSDGSDMDNYIVAGVTNEEQQQPFTDASYLMYDPGTSGSAAWARFGQTFKPSGGNANLRWIYLDIGMVTVPGTVIVKLWNGAADFYSGATPLGTATQTVGARDTTNYYEFDFGSPITVDNSGSTSYFFSVQSADQTQFNIWYTSTTSNYPDGEGLCSIYGGGGGSAAFVPGGLGVTVPFDLYFDTYSVSPATNTTFNNGPTNTIARQVMTDSYIANGGLITYDNASVPNGGGNYIDYTFKVNTVWEAIAKMIELSPEDYYGYVNVVDGKLYLRAASATAEHTLILNRHIESLDLGATVKKVKNNVYYTGGDIGGGVNLYLNVKDQDAIDANGGVPGLERLTNNRVTSTTVGTLEAQNFIDANKDQVYPTSVTVNDEAYDITLFNLGQMVDFAGFGNAIDNLLLQIVSITRTPYNITLGLGTLPFKSSSQVDKMNRQLISTQTVANPTTPS